MKDPLEQLDGVGPKTAIKLRGIGIENIESLALTPISQITSKTDIKYNQASKMVKSARTLIGFNKDFIHAHELWEKEKSRKRCSTGCKALDKLLVGGIETQAITEFVGEYGVGKTSICLKLAVMAQLPSEKGGLEGSTLYFDTEGTFSARRVWQIAEAMKLDPNPVLNKIIISKVYSSDHQDLLLNHAFKICKDENVKLVIVDSVISHFRSEYIGREMLAERQQRLNNYLHKLLKLAEIYNLAVVVTNQAQSNPQFFGVPDRPAGGHVLAHTCTHRVQLRRGKGSKRIARIFDSPYIPETECIFKISEKGIEDTEQA